MSQNVVTKWPELKLPYGFQEDKCLAPHALVRSSVFSTLEYSGAAVRPVVVKTAPLQLSSMSHYRVVQVEGPRLSQSDADVMFWMLARAYRYGAPKNKATVYFSRAEVLKALSRKRGGKTDAMLHASLQRLSLAEFHFEERDKVTGEMRPIVQTRLLESADVIEDDAKPCDYRVTIADGVAALLENGSWVGLKAAVRKELAGDPLALALYAQFESNQKVYATHAETLKGQMGRAGVVLTTDDATSEEVPEKKKNGMQTSKWLHALTQALKRVEAATKWPECQIATEKPHIGMVVVRKGNVRRKPPQKTL